MNKEQFLEDLKLKGFLVSKTDDLEEATNYEVIVGNKPINITFYDNFEERPLIPKEMKDFWLENLRSGKFQHGKDFLHKDGKFCCLGVWVYINTPELDEFGCIKNYPSKVVLNSNDKLAKIIETTGKFIGFKVNRLDSLTYLNDNSDSFEITSWVIEYFF